MGYVENIEENDNTEIASVNDMQNIVACSKTVDTAINSFEHNVNSVFDISNEVAAIKTLAPDAVYQQIINEIYKDEGMTIQEKNSQASLILKQRMNDQRESAQIVQNLQSKKAEDIGEIFDGMFDFYAGLAGLALTGLVLCTPVGRQLAANGLLFVKQFKLN